LNETNRDQVSDDLLDWLESNLAAPRLRLARERASGVIPTQLQ
jgi:hypothetical protein